MKSRPLYPTLAIIGILFFALALIGSLFEQDESEINIKEKNINSQVLEVVSTLKSLVADPAFNDLISETNQNNSIDLHNLFQSKLPSSDNSSLYVWKNRKLVYWDLGAYHMYFETIPIAEQAVVLDKEDKPYIKLALPPVVVQGSNGRPQTNFPGLVYVTPMSDIHGVPLAQVIDSEEVGPIVIPGLREYVVKYTHGVKAQFVYILFLFGYIFLLSSLFLLAQNLIKIYEPKIVIIGLIVVLLMLRGISLWFPLSHPLLNEFFQPHFFSPHIPGSMADWVLNVVIGFSFALFLYVHLPGIMGHSSRRANQIFTFLAYLIFCFFAVLFCFYVRALVDNQYIYININIIEYLSWGSLILLFITFLFLLSLFIISIRLFMSIQIYEWPWLDKMAIFFGAVVVSTLFLFWTNLEINLWLWVISLFIIMLLFDLFLDSSMRDFTWVSVWLLILSLFSTVLFFYFYQAKLTDRSVEALRQKITIPDQRLVDVVYSLDQKMKTVNQPQPSTKALLNDVLFTYPGINKAYHFSFGTHPKGMEFESFQNISYHFQNKWPSEYLFKAGKDSDSIILRVEEIGTEIGFTDKIKKYNAYDLFNTGDWTRYENRKITNDESLFFPPLLDSLSPYPVKDSQFVLDNTIYTLVEEGNRAALGRQEFDGLLQPMSFFSFNFILSLLILSLLLILHKFIPFLPKELHQYFIENLSIRNKIQFSVLAILIAAFTMIGIVSANFYKRSYKESLEVTVKEYYQKVKRAHFHKEETLKVLEGIPGQFILFDQEGKAIRQNKDNQYNRLPYEVVRKINLSNTLEHFDEIWPGALVLPFALDHSQTVFLAYPELKAVPDGFYRFINLLLNAFVFLLLISSALSFSISNMIISPLTELGSKLKEFSLGKRNEPIPWNQPDELGALIQSYNEMVAKLEQSAELLAHSEREVAWREMAKQVAHEIKNPLTPMKLSIQHMEYRIRDAEEEEARSIVRHVSKVLIEQIDNLSRIASEFSSFAKLPKPEYEEILLNDLVASVYDLFRTRSNIRFNLYVPIDELIVQADRTHLIRVLNNLMKNAVQAMAHDREGHIVIRLKEHQGHAIVMVEDNGKGIEEGLHEKVFFPNFTTKSSGTGLGLAICKNIIETFNGTIYFIKNKPHGTVFIFELPLVNS